MIDVLTLCPFCGCGCGMYLQVEGGRVTGVTPSRKHPISKGRLCARGWHAYEFVHHPDRLTTPLIRKRKKKTSGKATTTADPASVFRKASWEEALELAADRFRNLQSNHGNDSVGVIASAKCTNEDNYLLMKFTRALLQTNNIDNGAMLTDSASIPGLGSTLGIRAATNSFDELEVAEVILVFGSDPSQVHPQVSSRIIDAVTAGARLILIDPQKNQLSRFAEHHLQIRPGSYVTLINAMIHSILSMDLVDWKRLTEESANFDEFSRTLDDFDDGRVSEFTGLDLEDIRATAAMYARADKAMILYSTGVTQQASGIQNVQALANLAVLTGHLGRHATGLIPLLEQNNAQGVQDMGCMPMYYPGYQRADSRKIRERFERAWNCELPSSEGLSLLEMLAPGSVRGMWIVGENPLVSAPDQNQVQKTLATLDFLLVQDIFLTETAAYADIVFPAACYAEKEGTFTNIERRIQRIRKAVEPPGESLPDWKIIDAMAGKIGAEWKVESPERVMNEIASLTPPYAGVRYDSLDREWGIHWPCTAKHEEGTPILLTGYPHEAGMTFSLVEQDGLGKPHFTLVEDIPLVEPPDEEFPFTLTTGSLYYQWHSGTMTRRSATLNREYPEVFAAMNPKDAERLAIRDGERIRILSRRGEIETAAFLTGRVQENTVFIPFHYKDTAMKVLMNPRVDRKGSVPEWFCAVRIEKQ